MDHTKRYIKIIFYFVIILYLYVIYDNINDIENFIKGLDFETFVNSKEKIYATIYCLQVIGEAVKNLPEEIREKYQDMPWRKVAGMRDKLIHGYFTVDFDKVWETLKRDLPPLKKVITNILQT